MYLKLYVFQTFKEKHFLVFFKGRNWLTVVLQILFKNNTP